MKELKLIASTARDWAIGNKGNLLFPIKQDMKFFKETTTGNVVIMGRKTLDSFPGGKPLKNRVNIVFTRNKNFKAEGVITVSSIEELFNELENYNDKDAFVIGGGEIYSMLLPYCTEAYITRVNGQKEADTYLENLDIAEEWTVSKSSKEFLDGDYVYQFVLYERR